MTPTPPPPPAPPRQPAAPRRPAGAFQAVDTWAARVLLLNSALALAVALGLLGGPLAAGEAGWVFGAALLGFLAAVLWLRGMSAGAWGALPYYGLQLAAWYPADGGSAWRVPAGVSVGLVLRFQQGALTLNLVSLALLIVTLALLAWRRRRV